MNNLIISITGKKNRTGSYLEIYTEDIISAHRI
jgi:hypothetical protein